MKLEIAGCGGCPFLYAGSEVIERRCRAVDRPRGRSLPVNTRPPYGGEPTPDWCPAREGVEVQLVAPAARRPSAFAKMAAARPTRPGDSGDQYLEDHESWWFET